MISYRPIVDLAIKYFLEFKLSTVLVNYAIYNPLDYMKREEEGYETFYKLQKVKSSLYRRRMGREEV